MNHRIIKNTNGPDLGVTSAPLIERDGLIFKDLARQGELLPYEDWRLSPEERAKDLAARLSIEEIAGLMLYSSHQMVPFRSFGHFQGTYGGKTYDESGAKMWALTDQQKQFLTTDKIRHVLAMKLENADVAARWNNELQAFVENLPFGIPVNTSSDPRHGAGNADAEYRVSGGADTSKWPDGLGMAATFSPALCEEFARTCAEEYRALGIATALSPQIDLSTDPRWMRMGDTFGEHPGLATDMARAYCDGLQTTDGAENGWGEKSVVAMAKHWPGGGMGEGGRDAHYPWGKYAVYPAGNFDTHLLPFLNGAFKLNGPTKKAGAVMPYYTVSWDQDKKYGTNVGNSYSEYIIKDLLREKYGYDGVVCTDWGITADEAAEFDSFGSRCFGVEHLSEAERHLMILLNGVDQFGGNNRAEPILEAYRIGCERYGEDFMRARFEDSARRLLTGSFRLGLFENPYVEPEISAALVGSKENCEAGYAAQLKSIVLLKNRGGALPLKRKIKVYIPDRHIGPTVGFFRNPVPPRDFSPVAPSLVDKYFEIANTPEEADAAIVFIETPITDPYSREDCAAGGNGYLPVSLQFRPYTAYTARAMSIAGGDPLEASANRSYRGKTVIAANERDLDNILEMRARMGDKPVIVVAEMGCPLIPAEFERQVDAIVAHFGVQMQAVFDILCGAMEPSALLPIQIPRDMEAVEVQAEDREFDMAPYVDEQGHEYDFGYGLNWSGVISDGRTVKYYRPSTTK